MNNTYRLRLHFSQIPPKIYNHRGTISTPHYLWNHWKILGYRDLLKRDASVWINSMCNELGRLPQVWKAHTRTDTIKFILHKDKQKDRRATYVRDVWNIQPQKTETHRTRLTAAVNLIDYPGEVSTPTQTLPQWNSKETAPSQTSNQDTCAWM